MTAIPDVKQVPHFAELELEVGCNFGNQPVLPELRMLGSKQLQTKF